MDTILALLTGVILSIMVSVNGTLSVIYGVLTATFIIHLVGSIFASILCVSQKEKKPLWGHQPIWIYLGGAIGVLTTIFNNFSFGKISITSITALGLLGQVFTSLIIDHFGLLGMKKHPFKKSMLWGLTFSAAGILLMLDSTVKSGIFAVIFSFTAGISVILSRVVNSRLAEKTGALRGSLINHLVGLSITAALALPSIKVSQFSFSSTIPFKPWIYLGGILGVGTVLLCNITVPRMSAFKLTLLTFSAQVLTGIALDLLNGNDNIDSSFMGGLIISTGIILNMISDQVSMEKERKQKEYWDKIREAEAAHRKKILETYGEK